MEVSAQFHALAILSPGKEPPVSTGKDFCWVDPSADQDHMDKLKFLTLPDLELRPLGCPAHSQSLYRLR
jgi:hypothetical protein